MKPTILRDQATTPDGTPLTLHEHDGVFTIRVGGVELMSSRQHHSEERLAELACAGLRARPGVRVLVGGLGMGFTLRAALTHLAPQAAVVVVELVPAVVAWNRTAAYGLGADALADPRVELVEGDVAAVIRGGRGRFDAVILDVDNGARGLSVESNDGLYGAQGLAMAKAALRPGGCLAVWSSADDPAFADRMRRAGFAVTIEKARVHARGGGWTTIFIGRTAALCVTAGPGSSSRPS
jgi:spermidine synthase